MSAIPQIDSSLPESAANWDDSNPETSKILREMNDKLAVLIQKGAMKEWIDWKNKGIPVDIHNKITMKFYNKNYRKSIQEQNYWESHIIIWHVLSLLNWAIEDPSIQIQKPIWEDRLLWLKDVKVENN